MSVINIKKSVYMKSNTPISMETKARIQKLCEKNRVHPSMNTLPHGFKTFIKKTCHISISSASTFCDAFEIHGDVHKRDKRKSPKALLPLEGNDSIELGRLSKLKMDKIKHNYTQVGQWFSDHYLKLTVNHLNHCMAQDGFPMSPRTTHKHIKVSSHAKLVTMKFELQNRKDEDQLAIISIPSHTSDSDSFAPPPPGYHLFQAETCHLDNTTVLIWDGVEPPTHMLSRYYTIDQSGKNTHWTNRGYNPFEAHYPYVSDTQYVCKCIACTIKQREKIKKKEDEQLVKKRNELRIETEKKRKEHRKALKFDKFHAQYLQWCEKNNFVVLCRDRVFEVFECEEVEKEEVEVVEEEVDVLSDDEEGMWNEVLKSVGSRVVSCVCDGTLPELKYRKGEGLCANIEDKCEGTDLAGDNYQYSDVYLMRYGSDVQKAQILAQKHYSKDDGFINDSDSESEKITQ